MSLFKKIFKRRNPSSNAEIADSGKSLYPIIPVDYKREGRDVVLVDLDRLKAIVFGVPKSENLEQYMEPSKLLLMYMRDLQPFFYEELITRVKADPSLIDFKYFPLVRKDEQEKYSNAFAVDFSLSIKEHFPEISGGPRVVYVPVPIEIEDNSGKKTFLLHLAFLFSRKQNQENPVFILQPKTALVPL